MSTSKTSAKPAAGAAKGIDKAAIRKVIDAQRAIPGAIKSAKFAPRSQKRSYINHKRDVIKAKNSATDRSSSFKRMIKRAKHQKAAKAEHKKKVEQAAKDKKPAPAALVVSRAERKIQAATAQRKTDRDQKAAARKERVAKAAAFVKSLGPNPAKAFVAKGSKVPAELIKKDSKPLSKRAAKNRAHKNSTVSGAKRTVVKKDRKSRAALTLKAAVKSIERGVAIRGTVSGRAAIKAKVAANNAAARKAALDKRGGKPAKLHPVAAAKLAKFKALKEKKDKKWATKKAAVLKRVEDRKKGIKVKSVKKTTTKPFRAHKKIHIVNLDRVERSFKKHHSRSQAKLRSSIKPGTVVILLKGKYAGRRAIFLRQLPVSRDLLVTGPFALNGVPLYRISQSFVIATSTRIDIKGMPNLKSNRLSDNLFKVQRAQKAPLAHGEIKFFSPDTKKKPQLNIHRKPVQANTDKFLLPIIKKTPLLKEYLRASFSLSDKDAPHNMSF